MVTAAARPRRFLTQPILPRFKIWKKQKVYKWSEVCWKNRGFAGVDGTRLTEQMYVDFWPISSGTRLGEKKILNSFFQFSPSIITRFSWESRMFFLWKWDWEISGNLLSTYSSLCKMTFQINFFVFSRWAQWCTSDRPKINTLEHSSVFDQWGTFCNNRKTSVGVVLCQNLHLLGNDSTLQYKFALLRSRNGFFDFFAKIMRYKFLFHIFFTLYLLSSKFLKISKHEMSELLSSTTLIFGSTLVINCGDYWNCCILRRFFEINNHCLFLQ